MRRPSLSAFSLSHLAHASQASAPQIEQWIARKAFAPENGTAAGRARAYTSGDAVRVAVMAYVCNTCQLPVPIGSAFAQLLDHNLQMELKQFALFGIIFPEAAQLATTMWSQEMVNAITLAVGLSDGPQSVAATLASRMDTGAIIVNLSAIARAALQRLAEHLDEINSARESD